MRYFLLIVCFLVSQYANSQTSFKDKLTKDYFECKKNSDCTLVAGWCHYFAISKAKLSSFNNIPENEKNPPNMCPPGWRPIEMPKSVCIKKECSAKGGQPGL